MPILSRMARARTAAALTCLVVGLTAVDTSAAWAADPPVTLPGSVLPAVAHAARVGTLPGARTLSIALEMRLRDAAALAAFDTAVSTPGTADYGHYLTAAQFADHYGPTQSAVDAVRRFLDGAPASR